MKVDLIDACLQEEPRKGGERFLAEIAAAVEIVAARQVAFGEMSLVGGFAAGKPARHRPHRAGVERLEQHRVRHQTGDAPIAVEKGVNPQQAVMRGGRGQYGVGPADAAIDLLEAREEPRHGAGADGDVTTDAHVATAQFSRHDPQALAGVWIFDPQHLLGQQFAKAAVDVAQALGRDRAPAQISFIDPPLHRDMRFGLKLQIALLGVGAVVVLERTLDIDGMGVVPFDEVAVVAIHRPHEISQRGQHAGRQAAAEPGRLDGELDGKVGQRPAMPRGFADQQRLHEAGRLAAIGGRLNVRFRVLS